jgi:hypothetical protein
VNEEMQWIMAWWTSLFLSIGLGVYARDVGVGFISLGVLGFSLIGLSIIANRWHQIQQFVAARRES